MIRTLSTCLFAFMLILGVVSCQKEIDDPLSAVPNNNNNSNNNGDCKTCNIYYPYCDSSTYTYVDTMPGSVQTSTQTLQFIGDTLVDGKLFSKVQGRPTDPISYHNCAGGVTTVFGIPPSGNRVTQTILKSNEPVGATWIDVVTNGGQSFDYTSTIISKSLQKTVLSVPYNDVIQVHVTVSADIAGSTLVMAESDYFYAPNIGLIDSETYNMTSGTPVLQLHRVLQSYFIP